MKDYLGFENDRNKKNAALYEAILKKAWGSETQVLIGHHICTEQNKDLNTENEIPSADTLIFDHEIMMKVFGIYCMSYMTRLVLLPAEERDQGLRYFWNEHYPDEQIAP